MENVVNLFVGMKAYKWINENLEVLRIVAITDNDIKLKKSSGENIRLSINELMTNYTILNPDGMIGISIVNIQDLEDVIVTLYRRKEMDEKSPIPYCLCRQNVTDFFENAINPKFNSCGLSVTLDTLPEGVSMESILACDGVNKQKSIAVYIDDTLDTILSLLKGTRDYDNVLYTLFLDHLKYVSKSRGGTIYFEQMKNSSRLDGYCKTLKDLLIANNFMYDFMRGFNIYPLTLNMDSVQSNTTDMELFIKVLSDLLLKNISEVMILPYDKDIDLNGINHNYVLISDSKERLFIVAYKYTGKYHIPVEDVETSENIELLYNAINPSDNSSLTEAYQYIRYNTDKYKK